MLRPLSIIPVARLLPRRPAYQSLQIRMVEGHQVHRIKAAHAKTLKGKRFTATSPNGRFADGAAAINAAGGLLADVSAIGKNLFYCFGAQAASPVVVRVHFGMSGRHAAFHPDEEPAPGATTRLRLEAADGDVVTHLSAMTVECGGGDLLAGMLSTLGPDPLREDADAERFWAALQKSRRSVGYELMNQESIAGVGNIFRAEICHFARVHPDTPAASIDRPTFDAIWAESVRQLRAGFKCGSILTVPDEARPAMVDKAARRAVYNRPTCATCGGKVVSWDINARTAYACEACQPRHGKVDDGCGGSAAKKSAPRLFASKCAPDASSPGHLTVPQLRAALAERGVVETKGLAKAALVARLEGLVKAEDGGGGGAAPPATPAAPKRRRGPAPGTAGLKPADAAAAAAEKARAGEGRNVEHVPQDAGDATVWLGKKEAAAGPVTPLPAKAKKKARRAAA